MTKDSREESFVFLSPHTSEAREQLSFIYIQNTRFIVAVIDASVG